MMDKSDNDLKGFEDFNIHGFKGGITEKLKNSKNSKSENLSLHISAYENSNTVSDGKNEGLKMKEKNAKQFFTDLPSIIQNPFEFPRQQEGDQGSDPEVMQFKASQKLLNPNSSGYNNNDELPACKLCNEKDKLISDLIKQFGEQLRAKDEQINMLLQRQQRSKSLDSRGDRGASKNSRSHSLAAASKSFVGQNVSNSSKSSTLKNTFDGNKIGKNCVSKQTTKTNTTMKMTTTNINV